jgi:hypothetical protein
MPKTIMGILTQEEATAVRTAIASLNKTYAAIANELGGFSDKTLRVMLGTEDTTPKSVGIGIINNTKKMFPECFKQNQAQTIDTPTASQEIVTATTTQKPVEPIIKLINDPSLPQALGLIKLYGNQMHR